MGCPLRVQVGALYGSRAWQRPLQQAPRVVGLLLPVRALARRASEGSGLDRIETRPVELVGRGETFEKGVGRLVVWAGEEVDFEGVMGGFGRKTCEKGKGYLGCRVR